MEYLVWPEGQDKRARSAKTRLGAEVLAVLVGLETYLRMSPQRVCIAKVTPPPSTPIEQ